MKALHPFTVQLWVYFDLKEVVVILVYFCLLLIQLLRD